MGGTDSREIGPSGPGRCPPKMLAKTWLVLVIIQVAESHPIRRRCLVSPCKDDSVSPNIRVLLETVDDETRKPVQQATGYYIANKNYSLSFTPPPVTPTPLPTAASPVFSPSRPPHLFHFITASSSPASLPPPIVNSPIFLRADPLPAVQQVPLLPRPSSHPLVAAVYKNPSGVVRPSSQLQPPPFVVVKVKKVSPPPPIEIITTPRSQATLTPSTTVSPPSTVTSPTVPPSEAPAVAPSSLSTPSATSTTSTMDRPEAPTVGLPDRVETSTAVSTPESPIAMSEEELRRRVAAMMSKNQLLCAMFGICSNEKEVYATTVTPRTVYNPTSPLPNFEFRPRIVAAPTTPSPFQFVFEFASTMAPALHKLNQQLPLFSAQYAANPPPIRPHPKGLNPNNKLTLSSLLSSIVSSPLAAHCPSCVQLLLNLCPTEGRTSRDCLVATTTHKPALSTPPPNPTRSQNTFAFSFPNPITGQRIEAAAVAPTTTTLRPWQTTYSRASPTTTFDPFAPLMDDDVQYDFDFDKRPMGEVQYDEGGGYGLVGERRGVLPWSVNRAG